MGDTKDGALTLIDMFNDLGNSAKRAELEKRFGPEAVAGFMESGQLTGEMADALGDYADKLIGYNEQMLDYKNLIAGSYLDALTAYESKFNEMLEGFDNHADMLDSYLNIW
jgi:hypothetical protein